MQKKGNVNGRMEMGNLIRNSIETDRIVTEPEETSENIFSISMGHLLLVFNMQLKSSIDSVEGTHVHRKLYKSTQLKRKRTQKKLHCGD